MRVLSIIAFAVLALCQPLSTALAAEFTFLHDLSKAPYDEAVDGPCAARVTGLITDDDKELFFDSASYEPPTLCLDSPGGSLSAALEFPSNRQWATRVLPGEQCESACAIAFLRGLYATGNGVPGYYHDRAIWAGARLGFHGPALNVPETLHVDRTSVLSSFELAIATASGVFDLHQSSDADDVRTMNAYLFQRFIETPPDQMHYIDTVGEAMLSGIEVLGVAPPKQLDASMVQNVCENTIVRDEMWRVAQYNFFQKQNTTAATRLREFREDLQYFRTRRAFPPFDRPVVFVVPATGGKQVGFSGYYRSGRWEMACFVTLHHRDGNPLNDFRLGPYFEIWLEGVARAGGAMTASRVADAFDDAVNSGLGEKRYLSALGAYPFDAQLADLPKSDLYKRYFGEGPIARHPKKRIPKRIQARPSFDLSGHDIKVVKAADDEACIKACRLEKECTVAVHDRWNHLCFLKATAGKITLNLSAKSNAFIVEGSATEIEEVMTPVSFKKRLGKRFDGRAYSTENITGFERCAKACKEDSWCLGFNSYNEKPLCELFSEPPEHFDSAGVTIGFKVLAP